MPKIELITNIKADIDLIFDLSRSIDLHMITSTKNKEEAIAGRTSGLIELGETVTWRATHLGVRQKLTSIISGYDKPTYFADEMVKGAFKGFHHEHHFNQKDDYVEMIDIFDYSSPLGILGKLADFLFLEKYMRNFLIHRNNLIKEFAESDKWKEIIK